MTLPPIERLRLPPALGDNGPPSADTLKQQLDAQLDKTASGDAAADTDPKLAREYTFPFRFETADHRIYEGTFKNRALTIGERMRAGALASDLVGGRAFASLPGAAQQLAVAVSWMTYSLDPKSRPDWARDLGAIDDDLLLLALYGEVWDHQCTFLGRAHHAEPTATPTP